MRYFFLFFFLAIAATLGLTGFRGGYSTRTPLQVFNDMKNQAKLRPQTDSTFPGFADGVSSRAFPAGTVAQQVGYQDNTTWKNDTFNTGRDFQQSDSPTNFVEVNPVPVTSELLKRGQDRYLIYCQPCHGAQADGNGITKKLGMSTVANLHDPRIIKMNDGEIFNTITYGKNTMMGYGGNVPVPDRWAIVAYLRAVQLSRLGNKDDVPAPVLEKLK
jgi:mono/diheme cytochrome c family protein